MRLDTAGEAARPRQSSLVMVGRGGGDRRGRCSSAVAGGGAEQGLAPGGRKRTCMECRDTRNRADGNKVGSAGGKYYVEERDTGEEE